MALVTPAEVIEYGKLQPPAGQTAEQTSARNKLLETLISASEASLFEQIGYRFTTIPTTTGSVSFNVPGWHTRARIYELPKRMDMITRITNPEGIQVDLDTFELFRSGWHIRNHSVDALMVGRWTITGELGWPELPSAARVLLLTWTVDSYDTSGSVTQEVSDDGLTTIGFSTSLPIWQQKNLLQSLMK